LTEAPYFAWLEEVAHTLDPADGLRPWDLAFAAERGGPAPPGIVDLDGAMRKMWRLAAGLGLGQAAAGVRIDLAAMPYQALCYPVSPPDDVRILLNQTGRLDQSNGSNGSCRPERATPLDLLYHEFGHALHWRALGNVSPALRWDAPPFNEGMAYLWERLALKADWSAARVTGALDAVESWQRWWARRTLYRLRVWIARAAFEYRAYQQVDQGEDLLALFQQVHSEYLGVPFDTASTWVQSPFWTSHPVYWQNYVIGQAIASQTLERLTCEFDRLTDNPGVGAWLVNHYYRFGGALPWMDKVLRATGAPLGTTALIQDLAI
jgi:hypothetical protein